MMKVKCVNERETMISNITIGKCYFLDISTVYGDSEGDWFGKIYVDENRSQYIGIINLNHFSTVRKEN